MISPQLARLDEHLQRLRLNTVRERLEALLQEASAQELSYADFLDRLLSEEVTTKTAQHVQMRTNLARFPFRKGLDSFDFRYPASRHDDQHPGRLVPAEGQVEVGGRQADDRGSVSCGLPVDAAVPVDALPRDHGDLDRPQTACPHGRSAHRRSCRCWDSQGGWGNFR